MNHTKRKNFESAHPGVRVPDCYTLSPSESDEIRRRLRERLQIPESSDGLAILQKLVERASLHTKANALDDSFNLSDVMASLGVQPKVQVYVNWYRFDAIDRMAYDDVVQYFDDIWYPSSDDIEVFDSSLSWVLSVSHDGAVGFVKLGEVDRWHPVQDL